jgi:hypothetical protein
MEADLETLSDYPAHRRALLSHWQHYVVGKSSILLEKSPPNLTKIWWLRQVFPSARFIIMTRDPRAVAAATQKWSKSSLAELMLHWNVAYSKALRDFRKDDCTIVRYEDLVARPEVELARLANPA